MFINAGARSLLLQGERQKFLTEEWPRVQATIQRLGLKAEELLNGAEAKPDAAPPKAEVSKSSELKSSELKSSELNLPEENLPEEER
jgi:hypothetical protein